MSKGYQNGGQFTQPKCRKTQDGIHMVRFNYREPEFEDDLVHLEGECVACHLEFQKTYQQTEGLSVVAKSSRTVFDFNKEVTEIFVEPVPQTIEAKR